MSSRCAIFSLRSSQQKKKASLTPYTPTHTPRTAHTTHTAYFKTRMSHLKPQGLRRRPEVLEEVARPRIYGGGSGSVGETRTAEPQIHEMVQVITVKHEQAWQSRYSTNIVYPRDVHTCCISGAGGQDAPPYRHGPQAREGPQGSLVRRAARAGRPSAPTYSA